MVNLHKLGLGSGFLGMTAKVQVTKGEKIDKLEFIKTEHFCALKDTIKKVKNMPHRMGENICKLYI